MSKCYNFTVEQTCIGNGYVFADSEEEAIRKIKNNDYADIYDSTDTENGDIIEIWEDKTVNVVKDDNILLKFWNGGK